MVTLSSCLIWQIISFSWQILQQIDLQKIPILAKKIIFSDEAHFDLGGYVNKHNCRIWGTENPHAYIEKPTQIKRVTVWCGFWFRDVIENNDSSKINKGTPLQSMAIVIGPWSIFKWFGLWSNEWECQILLLSGKRVVGIRS